jgi:hypothetical protein
MLKYHLLSALLDPKGLGGIGLLIGLAVML